MAQTVLLFTVNSLKNGHHEHFCCELVLVIYTRLPQSLTYGTWKWSIKTKLLWHGLPCYTDWRPHGPSILTLHMFFLDTLCSSVVSSGGPSIPTEIFGGFRNGREDLPFEMVKFGNGMLERFSVGFKIFLSQHSIQNLKWTQWTLTNGPRSVRCRSSY